VRRFPARGSRGWGWRSALSQEDYGSWAKRSHFYENE